MTDVHEVQRVEANSALLELSGVRNSADLILCSNGQQLPFLRSEWCDGWAEKWQESVQRIVCLHSNFFYFQNLF